MQHYEILFRLCEHNPTMTAQAEFKNTLLMNLAHAQPGMAVRLAQRCYEFHHGAGQLPSQVFGACSNCR